MFASVRSNDTGDGSVEILFSEKVPKVQFIFRKGNCNDVWGIVCLDKSEARKLAAFIAVVDGHSFAGGATRDFR